MITNLENKLRIGMGGTPVLHSPTPESGRRLGGERGWTRTIDPCLKRALLCQLSYAPTFFQFNIAEPHSPRTTWGQPPPAVQRSEAPHGLGCGTAVEFHSTGQPGRLSPCGSWRHQLDPTG
jgi:hypothetical protein